MNVKKTVKTDYLLETIVCMVCFMTNVSQMPYLVESALTRYISIPVWVVLFWVCIIQSHKVYIYHAKILFGLIGYFMAYYNVMCIINSNFYKSALPYVILLSAFILITGIMVGRSLGNESIEKIGTSYIVSALFVAVNVFLKYIYGNSLVGSMYLYASKNSVSQILMTAWILILLYKFNENDIPKKLFWLICFAFLTYTMVGLKSRATLICMPFVLIWVLVHKGLGKKVKRFIIIILIIVVILMLNGHMADILINQIIFAGREVENLSSLSSGRTDEWVNFFKDWGDNWLFGNGRMKRESLVLTSLLEFGILGGVPILLIAIYPLWWGMKNLQKKNLTYLLLTSTAISYLINGIFEQLAPFGPGVKCYFLWFIFGIFIANCFRMRGV